ncbi:hypothetical protein OCK74_18655 [Chitinophagaceae bacterium LB-8]|uniref:Uncharacterized protein n=1 Tax=Paraflavisolibacter caeni TaxID=2982496 RepID=A0A9X2Y0Y9_9BACT|nr:hypothetical protein [Paraflavisolibacter caeni]MCU7551148.1 hypothetical protein [Paraflavisolibacter caeni]
MFHYLSSGAQKVLLVLLGLFSCSISFAQVTISGAECVLTGMVYQYDIKGDWKENDKINICVEGGVLVETNTTCVEKQTVSSIRLQWSAGRNTGKVTVSSQAGTADLGVNIAPGFKPGFIETADKQILTVRKIPASLSCTQASGGNCSPSFSYQWEESLNKVHWKEIIGATEPNLSFAAPLKQTTFFRRKVVESKSQTIGYTNEITVFVMPVTEKK